MLSFTFRYFFCFILLFITAALYGQQKSFEERYNEIYGIVSSGSAKESLVAADSLYHMAVKNEQRIKALVLLGTIYHGQTDFPNVLYHVTKAYNLAKKEGNIDWQARTLGLLASTYKIIGLLDEANKKLEEAGKVNEKQRDSPGYLLTKAKILQEKANTAIEQNRYNEAMDLLTQSDKYIHQDTTNSERGQVVRSINLLFEGMCYLYQDDKVKADSVFFIAKETFGSPSNIVIPYIYRARAENALKHQEYDSAYHYIQLMEPFVQYSENLEMLIYRSYAMYYKGLGDNEKAIHYLERNRDMTNLRTQKANEIMNEFVRKLNEDNLSYRDDIAKGWWVLLGTVFFFCLVLLFSLTKRRKEKAKYIHMIEHLQTRNTLPRVSSEFSQEEEVEEPEKSTKGPLISKDTELRLLSALEKLEETAFFLEKDISLASLSVLLHTNQRYMSHIIRKYKDKDFNSYIQHYRITYIINRVRLEPELLDYKLSYLADLAGFSSHSKFSAVFKSVTGLPPSVFIHYTKEEVKKNKPITS